MSLLLDDDYPLPLAMIAVAAYDWLTSQLKLDHATAAEGAMNIAEAARANLGGGHIYIPKGQEWALSRRDREIWSKFNGTNYQALAREHDLTEMRIRQIVERCRNADVKARQKGLFSSEGEP